MISTRGKNTVLDIQAGSGVRAVYPDGSEAGERSESGLKVHLAPVDRKLVPARFDWGPEGIMIDSTGATDSVIIEGLCGRSAWIPSALQAVEAEADAIAAGLPEEAGRALSMEFARTRVRSDITTQGYIAGINKANEEFFSRATPYIWVEGEDAVSHNYNYSRLGAIPSMSGTAFLGLETAVEPPADTGWYASYEFEAPEGGVYQLWMRENYLSFSSPCSYRIDDGEWAHATNMLVPHDIRVVTHYNAVEDSRQVFAWYHYGGVRVPAGRHTLTIRVDKPRPRGTVLTMADDRPYAKLIDCILLTRRHFKPDGIRRPRYLIDEVRRPMVNLLANPSMEFDGDGDGRCDGWTPSHDSGMEWTKPGWGNIRVEGLFDINLHLRDSYAQLRSLRIEPGPEERVWSGDAVELGAAEVFLASAWVRATGLAAYVRVRWLDAGGKVLRQDALPNTGDGVDWHEVSRELTRPAGAVSAVFECVLEPGASGPARFDDAVFAGLAGPEAPKQ